MMAAGWFVEEQIVSGNGPYYQRHKNQKVEPVFAHCNHIIWKREQKSCVNFTDAQHFVSQTTEIFTVTCQSLGAFL